jgi:hypothetical protein
LNLITMSSNSTPVRSGMRARLLGAAVAAALGGGTTQAKAAFDAGPSGPPVHSLQGVESRPAEIRGTLIEEAQAQCPPAAAVTIPLPSALSAPLEFLGPITPVSEVAETSREGDSSALARGTGSKLTPRGSQRALPRSIPSCPPPLVSYVPDPNALGPVDGALIGPMGGPLLPVAGAGSSLLGLAALPVGAVPFFLGGGSTAMVALPPVVSVPVSPIPEPATWLTMICGFFTVGWVLRRSRSHKLGGAFSAA